MVGLELRHFWRNSTEVKSHFLTSHRVCILSLRLTTAEADLEHRAETVFIQFLHYKAALPLFPYCTLWEKSLSVAPLKEWGKHLL